ncbi:hypothetical protein N7495_000253 [Penicillium taxi]|uniref:uncharacterized protein n=1 Tax=Penicillium taxi TaxID=168475 RepID=UPI002544E5F3|nr:uncharacterized protein N7495_000253 [Penicillium taxi]KAJ5907571.1 hypothetical protein N7495_000253 [Penicillium taxi]
MTGISPDMPAKATTKKRSRDESCGDDPEDVGAPRKRSREATPEQVAQSEATQGPLKAGNTKKRSHEDCSEDDLEDGEAPRKPPHETTPEQVNQSVADSTKPATSEDTRSTATSGSTSHSKIVSITPTSPIIKLEARDSDKEEGIDPWTLDNYEHDSDWETISNVSTIADNDKNVLPPPDFQSTNIERQASDSIKPETSEDTASVPASDSTSHPENVSTPPHPVIKVDINEEESQAAPIPTEAPDNGFATSAFAKATSSFASVPKTSAFGTFGGGFSSVGGGFKSAPGLSGGGLTSFATTDKPTLSSFASPKTSAFGTLGTESSSVGSGFKSASSLGSGLTSFASNAKPTLSSFASPKTSAFGALGTESSSVGSSFKSAQNLTGGLTSFASNAKPTSSSFSSSKTSAFGTLGTEPSNVGCSVLSAPGPSGPETGEEGETTIFTCKGKLYHFVNKEWKERGFGTFKVNSREDDGKKAVRMIMRADGAGRVMLNSPIFKGMGFGNPKNEAPEGRRVFLTTTEEGSPVTLLLRTGSEATAMELFEVLEELQ